MCVCVCVYMCVCVCVLCALALSAVFFYGLIIHMKKFLHSDWLKAVQFFLTKCKKAKQSTKMLSKIQIAKNLTNITLLEFQNFAV